jgi:hypothetical protein
MAAGLDVIRGSSPSGHCARPRPRQTQYRLRGVKVELCGATAKAHGWGNKDLLPDIKVNTDAMARTTQLVQQGFVKITE